MARTASARSPCITDSAELLACSEAASRRAAFSSALPRTMARLLRKMARGERAQAERAELH